MTDGARARDLRSYKYAVEALSDALRYEVKSFGVAIILVQPTGVRTPFVETPTAFIPENEGPYAAFNENYNTVVKATFAEGARGIVSAEDVAGVIVEVTGAARPRAPATRWGSARTCSPGCAGCWATALGTPRWRGSSPNRSLQGHRWFFYMS